MSGEFTGRTLGNWRILGLIGEGSFGAVYEAQNATIAGRRAAVKILHPKLAFDAEVKRRFINEASAASRAEHENIVQIFDAGVTDDGTCFAVMEFLKGRSLAGLLEEGPLDQPRAVNIAIQVASALRAAHEIGIVHRDLKPDNIFVTSREANPEFAKVLDFGVAKLRTEAEAPTTSATRAGMLIGTPGYMSPEQWMTLPDIDGRADVYALGVILFECLTGRLPFSGRTPYEWLTAHMTQPVPELDPVETLTEPMADLVRRMMAKDPADRPQTMADVWQALRVIRGPTNVLDATTPSGSHPAMSPSGSHPAMSPSGNRPVVSPTGTQLSGPRQVSGSGVVELGQATALPSSLEMMGTQAAPAVRPVSAQRPVASPSGQRSASRPVATATRLEGASPSAQRPIPLDRPLGSASRPVARQPSGVSPAPVEDQPIAQPGSTLSASHGEVFAEERPGRPARSHLPSIVAAFILVVGLGAGVGFWYARQHNLTQPDSAPTVDAGPAKPALPAVPPEMVVIGPGEILIGAGPPSQASGPPHKVAVARFALGRHETSMGDYRKYVETIGQKTDLPWEGVDDFSQIRDLPVTLVTRDEALRYCQWRYATEGGRLPTEAEWEYAARDGKSGQRFPWGGDRLDDLRANIGHAKRGELLPVASLPNGATASGLRNMIGNVAEWTASVAAPYPGSTAALPRGEIVVRGGASNSPETEEVTAMTRHFAPPDRRGPFLGFRCAYSLP